MGLRCNCICPGITDTPMLRYHLSKSPDPEATLRRAAAASAAGHRHDGARYRQGGVVSVMRRFVGRDGHFARSGRRISGHCRMAISRTNSLHGARDLAIHYEEAHAKALSAQRGRRRREELRIENSRPGIEIPPSPNPLPLTPHPMRNTRATQLLFELSKPGRRTVYLPKGEVPEVPLDELLPAAALSPTPPPLPELGESELVRHFANLSTQNMSVDTHFYPLGSCTMKYNPKRNERCAGMPGIADLHPYQPESTLQGMLQLLYERRPDAGRNLRARRRFAATGRGGSWGIFRLDGRRRLFPRPGSGADQGARPRQRPRHESRQRRDGRLRDRHGPQQRRRASSIWTICARSSTTARPCS